MTKLKKLMVSKFNGFCPSRERERQIERGREGWEGSDCWCSGVHLLMLYFNEVCNHF